MGRNIIDKTTMREMNFPKEIASKAGQGYDMAKRVYRFFKQFDRYGRRVADFSDIVSPW